MKLFPAMLQSFPDLYSECRPIDFDPPAGWFGLAFEASGVLHGSPARIRCVKQKMGELRIEGTWFNVDQLVVLRAIAERSRVLCETCGKHGTMRSRNGYVYVGCDEHVRAT
jgi:hypothetical protein